MKTKLNQLALAATLLLASPFALSVTAQAQTATTETIPAEVTAFITTLADMTPGGRETAIGEFIKAHPAWAVAVTQAAIAAYPLEIVAIVRAAILAAPESANDITIASITAAPNQATEIANAAYDVAPNKESILTAAASAVSALRIRNYIPPVPATKVIVSRDRV
jgi:hypothetical protein